MKPSIDLKDYEWQDGFQVHGTHYGSTGIIWKTREQAAAYRDYLASRTSIFTWYIVHVVTVGELKEK